ncbi:MAG: Fic family protein [Nanoarchaeota archaeon]|nr:Fic family protein [Nanoarchaeota archaeon]
MAYIHVKKIGNTKYYTLRISVRKGNNIITKDIENLGTDLSKIDLYKLEKKHKSEIRKSFSTLKKFIDSNHYLEKAKEKKLKSKEFLPKNSIETIEAINLHYTSRFLKLDVISKKEIFDNFLLKFAVNSTSIEGNTITLEQAARLFKEDILPKGKTLREVYDLKNTRKVFFWLLEELPDIDIQLIIRIHDWLLDEIDKRNGIRTTDIRIFGSPFKPTPAQFVRDDLNVLVSWYKASKLHPLVKSVLFHHKFENIHPFYDGNGRTGRLVLNLILLKNNFPPLIVSRRHRKEYLDRINDADKAIKSSLINDSSEHYQGLVDFIVSEYKESYWDTFLV